MMDREPKNKTVSLLNFFEFFLNFLRKSPFTRTGRTALALLTTADNLVVYDFLNYLDFLGLLLALPFPLAALAFPLASGCSFGMAFF